MLGTAVACGMLLQNECSDLGAVLVLRRGVVVCAMAVCVKAASKTVCEGGTGSVLPVPHATTARVLRPLRHCDVSVHERVRSKLWPPVGPPLILHVAAPCVSRQGGVVRGARRPPDTTAFKTCWPTRRGHQCGQHSSSHCIS